MPEAKLDRLLLVLTLLVGFALKLPYLATYMYGPDEGWQILAADAPSWRDTLARNWADITHPPFTVLLMHFLLQLHDAIWVPRLAGVVSNTALAFAGYQLGKTATGDRAVGVLLALEFTFGTAFAALAVVVRGYTYMLLFLVSSLVFYFRYVREERSRDLALYSACAALAVFSEYCASLAVFACGFIQAIRLWRAYGFVHRKTLLWCGAHALLAAWFLTNYLQHPFTKGQVEWPNQYYYGNNGLLAIVFIAASCAIVGAIMAGWRRRSAAAETLDPAVETSLLLLALMMGVAVVADAWELYPLSLGRHGVYLAPFYLLPVFHGLATLLSRYVRPSRWLPGIALAYVVVHPTIESGDFMLPVSEIPTLNRQLRSLPEGSAVLVDTQAHFMLFKSEVVDSISEDARYVTMHAGDTSLVKINQPPISLRAKDGRHYGNFFLTPEDLALMLTDVAPENPSLYLLEMGFRHGTLTTQCEPEARARLHPLYETNYVQLYSIARADGKRLAEECIARRDGPPSTRSG